MSMMSKDNFYSFGLKYHMQHVQHSRCVLGKSKNFSIKNIQNS